MRYINFDPRAAGPRTTAEQAERRRKTAGDRMREADRMGLAHHYGPRMTVEELERGRARAEMEDKLRDQIANGQDIDETETNDGDAT